MRMRERAEHLERAVARRDRIQAVPRRPRRSRARAPSTRARSAACCPRAHRRPAASATCGGARPPGGRRRARAPPGARASGARAARAGRAAGVCSRAAARRPRASPASRSAPRSSARAARSSSAARPQPQREVSRDLVVAAAPGVQLPGHGPDDLEQAPLDVRVHVLERRIEHQGPALQLLRDLLQTLHQGLGLAWRHDLLAAQHARVGDAAPHVLAEQLPVHMDRGREALHGRVTRLRQARARELLSCGRLGLLGIRHGEPRGGRECRRAGGAARTRCSYPTGVLKAWLRNPAARIAMLSAILLALTGVWLARAVSRLDERVETRFRGQLFAVPSRVYARPVSLRNGVDIAHIHLRARLERMGYVPAVGSAPRLRPGEFAVRPGAFDVFRRASRLPNRYTPEQLIHLRLDGTRVTAVRDANDELLSSAELEPELIAQFHGAERADRKLVALGDVPPDPGRRGDRGRGPVVLRAPRHPGLAHRGRVPREPARGEGGAGRQHADAAAREELLPHARAHVHAQAHRSRHGAPARAQSLEAGDSRGVSQRSVHGPARLGRDPRRGRGGESLLRKAGERADPARSRAARRPHQGPEPLLAVPQPRSARESAAIWC